MKNDEAGKWDGGRLIGIAEELFNSGKKMLRLTLSFR